MHPKLQSRVDFLVASDVPHRLLTEATEAGLAAARGAIGEGAFVEAQGSMKSAPDGRRLVRFDLALRAAPPAALSAEAAFVGGFLGKLTAKGHAAERV